MENEEFIPLPPLPPSLYSPREPFRHSRIEWPSWTLPDSRVLWCEMDFAYWTLSRANVPAQEALAVGHAKLVHYLALRKLGSKRHREFREKPQDVGGGDLFAEGLLAIVEQLSKGLRIDDREHLSRYIAKIAANAMYHSRLPRKHKTETMDPRQVDCSPEEYGHDFNDPFSAIDPPSDLHTAASAREIPEALIERETPFDRASDNELVERAQSALAACCTEPDDAEIVSLKLEGRLTETEIGQRIGGKSRDQVNRSLHRVLREVFRSLGMSPWKTGKRKKEPKESDELPSWPSYHGCRRIDDPMPPTEGLFDTYGYKLRPLPRPEDAPAFQSRAA